MTRPEGSVSGREESNWRAGVIVKRPTRLLIRRLDLSGAAVFPDLRRRRRQSHLTAPSIGDLAAILRPAGELLSGKPHRLVCSSALLDVFSRQEVGPSRVA
jgi:hypothetical protein